MSIPMPMLGGSGTKQLHLHTSWRSPAPFSVGLLRDHSRKSSRYRCAADSNGSQKQDLSRKLGDDVMQRLREAEKEAAELREQLAKAKAEAVEKGDTALLSDIEQQQEQTAKQISRITGTGMRREALFGGGDESWLKEKDLNFFARGPAESADSVQSPDGSGAVVARRLIIGLGLTGAAIAFALIPTADLRQKPPKPLFFYLTPLYRIQELLTQAEQLAVDGRYSELQSLLLRIQGQPNSARENLINSFSCLTDKTQRSKAERIAFDLIEYLDQIDYNKYFEAMGQAGTRGGEREKLFSDFSAQSIKAAQGKLKQFLALMPADDAQAGQQAAAGGYF